MWRWLSVFVALVGCRQTLDLGGGDAAGTDASIDAPTVDASGSDAGAGCGVELLVGLRSLDDGEQRIARFDLDASPPARCEDLSGGDALGTIHVLGWLDETRIVLSSDREVQILDARDDRVIDTINYLDPPSVTPLDAFGLTDGAGDVWGVVSIDVIGGDAIDRFLLVRLRDGMRRTVTNEEIDLRFLEGCDASADRAAMICTEPIRVSPPHGTEAAAKRIDVLGTLAWDTLVDPLASGPLAGIDVLGERMVWSERRSEPALDHAIRTLDPPASAPSASLACTTSMCASPRRIVDVAVDPRGAGRYLFICEGESDGTSQRWHVLGGSESGGPCEVVLDGATLPPDVVPRALDTRALGSP